MQQKSGTGVTCAAQAHSLNSKELFFAHKLPLLCGHSKVIKVCKSESLNHRSVLLVRKTNFALKYKNLNGACQPLFYAKCKNTGTIYPIYAAVIGLHGKIRAYRTIYGFGMYACERLTAGCCFGGGGGGGAVGALLIYFLRQLFQVFILSHCLFLRIKVNLRLIHMLSIRPCIRSA